MPKPTGPLTEAPSRNHLGYYHTPYGKFLSVTTIIDKAIAKPELQFWYAKEAAQCAVDNIPLLARARGDAARVEAYEWIRDAARRIKDDAADKGSAIHRAISAHILDAPSPDLDPDYLPFMAAFGNFLHDWAPEWEATEMVVANPGDGWAGTCDWWAWIQHPDHGRVLVVGDTKTGKPDTKRKKGCYPEAAVQLSGYKNATVGWLRDGTEVTPPRAEHAVILHIRPDYYPDRGYALLDVQTGPEYYAWFLACRDVATGVKTLAGKAIGAPLTPPNRLPEVA